MASTENEEAPAPPNWLLKLEEQREKRLKAKLGHETGAGALCQVCGDKCPGLDLHFWRKICKICKCGKEDHDISDEDIYGFVQFTLLGSKPIKAKGIILKGRNDEVILEFTPKGSSNDVKKYLDELPAEMLPVKGSEAAKMRKQRLQKQMPAHDIDPTLCHALTEQEIKELEEYVAHIRKHSVGQGVIIRLPLFKGTQHTLTKANAQFLSQNAPNQLSSSQTVFLQSPDLANNLQNLSLRDKNLPPNQKTGLIPQNNEKLGNIIIDSQNPTLMDPNKTRDIIYNPNNPDTTTEYLDNIRTVTGLNNETVSNLRNNANLPNFASKSVHQIVDNQNPMLANKITDLKYPVGYNNPNVAQDLNNPKGLEHKNPNLNQQFPNNPIRPSIYEQTPTNTTNIKNIVHPLTTSNVERHQEQFENPNFEINNANLDRVYNPNLSYAPNYINPIEQHQIPAQIGQPKDLKYPQNYDNSNSNNIPMNNANIDKIYNPLQQFNPNYVNPVEQFQNPTQIGQPKDLKYPSQIGSQFGQIDPNNPKIPYRYGSNNPTVGDPTYPVDQFGQPLKSGPIYDENGLEIPPPINESTHPNYKIGNLDQTQQLMPQNLINPCETTQNVTNVGNIKDINYPGSDLNEYNSNIPSDQINSRSLTHRAQIPVLQAQNLINPLESNQNLTSVGYLQDINYPVEEGSFNVLNSNLAPTGPPPFCHECKEAIVDGSIAVTAERTSNLWHSKCFNCHSCKQPLADLLYLYHKESDNIYCGRDYAIFKGIPRCAACDELIFLREYCLAEDSTFHVKHFCCFECDQPLAGKSYVMENSQPVCVECYENLKAENCQDCKKVIRPDQQGVNLQNFHWHADKECFACKKCRKPLLGEKMLLRTENLFCSDMCFKNYI